MAASPAAKPLRTILAALVAALFGGAAIREQDLALRAQLEAVVRGGAPSRAAAFSPISNSLKGSSRASSSSRIGASIAVHPPKFPLLARFLEQLAACPAAHEAMSVFPVFASVEDRDVFVRKLGEVSPGTDSKIRFTPVVASVPPFVTAAGDQFIAAWKKWFGISYMMDLGDKAPDYGLMLDAELNLYDPKDCGDESAWHGFLARLKASEASKQWPAAQVDTSQKYDFGPEHQNLVLTGRSYDRELMHASAQFLTGSTIEQCPAEGCALIREQLKNALFSWWTDVPYVNLHVAGRMLTQLRHPGAEQGQKQGDYWRQVAQSIKFPRFEHITYQQWCVMHEGYTINDVTHLTGMAHWGSYQESPNPGSKLAELRPLWVASEVLALVEEGKLKPMDATARPLLVFHVDHHAEVFSGGVESMEQRWGQAQ